MKVECRLLNDVALLKLEGPLDCGNGDRELRKIIDDLVKQGRGNVIVSLAGVSHMDTTCLGLLIAAHVRFQRLGGALRLCAASQKIRYLLSIARLDQVLVNFAEEKDAVGSFSSSPTDAIVAMSTPIMKTSRG